MRNDDISWIWQAPILKNAIIGAVISALLVLLFTMPFIIKPNYESEVIVFVPLTILSQQLNQQGIGFASEKEIDWYIQILKSNHLADSLINRFNLINYYKIDTSILGAKSRLYEKLDNKIQIEKTRYGSVSVKVRDNDPNRAAALANKIIDIGEIIKKNLFYRNRLESMKYVQRLYEQTIANVTLLEIKLDSLEKHKLDNKLRNSLLFDKTFKFYNLELQELISRKDLYEREQKNFDTPLPKAYVISSAVPSQKPVSPRPKLYSVLGAGIYLFLFLTIQIIRRDIYKETSKK